MNFGSPFILGALALIAGGVVAGVCGRVFSRESRMERRRRRSHSRLVRKSRQPSVSLSVRTKK